MVDETEINGILKEAMKNGWEDTIDNCFAGVHEISAKITNYQELELSTADLLEIMEGLKEYEKAEVLLAIEKGDYEANYYQGDTPRKDFATLEVAGHEFDI